MLHTHAQAHTLKYPLTLSHQHLNFLVANYEFLKFSAEIHIFIATSASRLRFYSSTFAYMKIKTWLRHDRLTKAVQQIGVFLNCLVNAG